MARAAALLAGLALVAGACAQSTKGQTVRGYTFGSDVAPYLAISKDITAIKGAINSRTPNWNKAQAIYTKGSNAKFANGTALTLQSLATNNPGSAYWDTYSAFFGNPAWLDENIQRALSGEAPYTTDVARVQMLVKSLESATQSAAVMGLLDSAVALAKAGKTDAATGAPSKVDAAWALFAGSDAKSNLWTVAMKRAGEYGTKVTCDTSYITEEMRKAFLAAQNAAKAGNAAALTQARNRVQGLFSALFVQAIVTYVHEMSLDKAAELAPTEPPAIEHQIEAYAFFRTIAPLLDAANANASQAVYSWIAPEVERKAFVDDMDIRTAKALASSYKGLGITSADVGKLGTKQPSLQCEAVSGPAAGVMTMTQARDDTPEVAMGRRLLANLARRLLWA